MNLREQASADLQTILEDSAGGFGWSATITNPEGISASLTGTYRDIHLQLDLETGQYVSGRQSSLVVPLAALLAAGLERPKGIASKGSKPWLVELIDLQGIARRYKVSEALPDEIGCLVMMLEAYEQADS